MKERTLAAREPCIARRTLFPAVLLASLLLVSPGHAENIWTFVTIPDLPSGAYVFRSWTDQPDNLYVWGGRSSPTIEAFLYHWDGATWTQDLFLPDHDGGLWAGHVFGTGPSDVFASTSSYADSNPHMYHYDGVGWTEQALPAEVNGIGCNQVLGIVGEPGNVYASLGCSAANYRLRYDGNQWQVVQSDASSRWPAYVGQDEIYAVGCWGHLLWNGATWNWYAGFDFCDVWNVWGMRDAGGQLHLYASGANNFNNGIRVWQFVEDSPGSMTGSWGSKYGTVFSDPPGTGYSQAGNSYSIWGSGPDDIYVTGWRDTDPATRGRVFHFDGASWEQITVFGDITTAYDVSGSGPDNVWISLADGRLLHHGPVPQQVPMVSTWGLVGLMALLLGALMVVDLRLRTRVTG